ncbi:MAG: type II secretion system protein [Planctomycetota bacterium]
MRTRPRNRAFTLVEILIVVVILGILAAIITPAMANASDSGKQATFVQSVRVFADAIELYRAKTGSFPPDGSSGTLAAPLANGYIDPDDFNNGTPIGGVWDNETNESGVVCAVGVHFNGDPVPSNEFLVDLDASFDDGNLATGRFRSLTADRFYLIIE